MGRVLGEEILVFWHLVQIYCWNVLYFILLEVEHHTRMQLVLRNLDERNFVQLSTLVVGIIILDEKYLFRIPVDNACYCVALLESEGLDFVVEFLSGIGPDTSI